MTNDWPGGWKRLLGARAGAPCEHDNRGNVFANFGKYSQCRPIITGYQSVANPSAFIQILRDFLIEMFDQLFKSSMNGRGARGRSLLWLANGVNPASGGHIPDRRHDRVHNDSPRAPAAPGTNDVKVAALHYLQGPDGVSARSRIPVEERDGSGRMAGYGGCAPRCLSARMKSRFPMPPGFDACRNPARATIDGQQNGIGSRLDLETIGRGGFGFVGGGSPAILAHRSAGRPGAARAAANSRRDGIVVRVNLCAIRV